MGDDFANVGNFEKWIKSSAGIFSKSPELRAPFSNFENAKKLAVEASNLAKSKVAQGQVQAAAQVMPGIRELNKFAPKAPPIKGATPGAPIASTSPAKIGKEMQGLFDDVDPNSMASYVKAIGGDATALAGAKRIVGDLMVKNESPHLFFDTNLPKIKQLFTSPDEVKFLEEIAKASRKTEADLLSPKFKDSVSLLSLAQGPSFVLALRGWLGIMGSSYLSKAVSAIARGPREAVNRLILDAMMDPTGAKAKLLMTPVWRFGKPDAENITLLLTPYATQPEEKPPVKKAIGGPVTQNSFVPPQIASMRSARAQQRGQAQ